MPASFNFVIISIRDFPNSSAAYIWSAFSVVVAVMVVLVIVVLVIVVLVLVTVVTVVTVVVVMVVTVVLVLKQSSSPCSQSGAPLQARPAVAE